MINTMLKLNIGDRKKKGNMYKPRWAGALNLAAAIARERKEVYNEIYRNGNDGERLIATSVDPNAKTIWSDTE